MKKGDIVKIANANGAQAAIADNLDKEVMVVYVSNELCWIRILEGVYKGYEVPCLVSRIEQR